MNNTDKEYFRLLNLIIEKGKLKKNRTGINTIGIFGEQSKYVIDLNAFPILTTKKVFFKAIVHELLWFIKGDTNIKYLVDNDVHIWDAWAYSHYEKVNEDYLKSNEKFAGQRRYDKSEFIDNIKNDEDFAKKWGELGEGTYGGMWRAFPYRYKETIQFDTFPDTIFVKDEYVDQLQKVIDKLKTNPDDRRMIVSAWHPYWVDHCALPPCHCLFHFNTEELTFEERMCIADYSSLLRIPAHGTLPQLEHEKLIMKSFDKTNVPKRKLNCLLYQRSNDFPLGIPFNLTSYSLLTAMIAHCVNMVPGTFVHTYGDAHIYENQLDGIKEQLKREPKQLPKLWLNPEVKSLFDFKYDDIKLIGYDPHPTIKMEVAV